MTSRRAASLAVCLTLSATVAAACGDVATPRRAAADTTGGPAVAGEVSAASSARLRAGHWSVPVPRGWSRERVPDMPFELVRLTSGSRTMNVLWGAGDPTLRDTVHHGLVNARDALRDVRVSHVTYDRGPDGFARARYTLTGTDPATGATVAQAVAVLENARRSFLGLQFQIPGTTPPSARLQATLRGLRARHAG